MRRNPFTQVNRSRMATRFCSAVLAVAFLASSALIGCGPEGETEVTGANRGPAEPLEEARDALSNAEKTLLEQMLASATACLEQAEAQRQRGHEAAALALEESALTCYADAKTAGRTVTARRKLEFPEEWSGGDILVREWDFSSDWEEQGPAVGSVKIEKRRMVQFAANPEFADADMNALSQLPPGSIQYLNFGSANQLTDAALEHVASMKGLLDLSLYRAQVTDRGLAKLKALPYLRQLNVMDTLVTSEGVWDTIPALVGLTDLALRGSSIDDRSLCALRGCRRLERLLCLCSNSEVSDVGLDHLAALPNLGCLWLSGPRITDHGIPLLTRHSGLGELVLMDTAITDEGVRSLKQALPECDVSVK